MYRSADCGSSQPASRRATPYGEPPMDSVVLRGSLRSAGLGCPAVEGASRPYARTVCCGRPKTGTSADRTGKTTTAARGSAAENVIETGRGCFSGGRIRRNGTLYCLVRQIWDQYPPPDARHAAKTDCRFIPNADPLQRRKPRFPYPVVARMPRIDRSLGGKTKIDFQIFTL